MLTAVLEMSTITESLPQTAKVRDRWVEVIKEAKGDQKLFGLRAFVAQFPEDSWGPGLFEEEKLFDAHVPELVLIGLREALRLNS